MTTESIVRIDKGIKRGPRKPPAPKGPKNGKLANYKGSLAPLKNVDPKEVLERYLADERTADIAAEYQVSRSALNQWLLRVCEEDWKESQVARAITRKESAEDELETAADPLSLARAREKLRSAQWDLERVCRRIYGDKLQVEHIGVPILNITIAAPQHSGLVIDQMPENPMKSVEALDPPAT